MNIKKKNWLLQLLFIVLIAVTGKTLYHFYAVVIFPYDITNGEGFVLRDAYNIYKNIPIYQPPDRYPFLVSNYPPLFAWLAAQIMILTGPSFIATRLLSALACLGLTLAIVTYLKILRVSWQAAIMASLFFLGSMYIFYWGAWSRVDTLAAFFSIISVILIAYKQDIFSIGLAALFCVLAFYTKQSALASWLSISIYLLLRNKKLFLYFSGIFFILLISSFLMINTETQGQFFNHIVTYNKLKWYPRVFVGQIKNFIGTHILFVLSYILFVINGYWKQSGKLLVLIYASITLGTTLTTGREGASTNYFIESIAILAVTLGLALNRIFWVGKPAKTSMRVIIAAIVVQLLIICFPSSTLVAVFNRNTQEFGLNPDQATRQRCDAINFYVAQAQGSVLVENPGFAVINAKEVIGNATVLKYFRRMGWNQPVDGFIKTIDDKSYEVIIFQGEAYDLDVLQATDRSYHEVARIDCIGEYEIKLRNP